MGVNDDLGVNQYGFDRVGMDESFIGMGCFGECVIVRNARFDGLDANMAE